MAYQILTRTFKVVGLKGKGPFENFDKEVPALAKQLLNRSQEIKNHTGVEMALFEPKRDKNHRVGEYYVGLMVDQASSDVPQGMAFMETTHQYVTTRGKISKIGTIHLDLLQWANEQNYTRNLDSYIVETYHPMEDGEEEVQIYLPIH